MVRAEIPKICRGFPLIIDTESHLGNLYTEACQFHGSSHMADRKITNAEPSDNSFVQQLTKFADGGLPLWNLSASRVRRVQAGRVRIVCAQPIEHALNRLANSGVTGPPRFLR